MEQLSFSLLSFFLRAGPDPLERSHRSDMRVLFRTDASIQIGGGHLMRCLTLAGQLREEGAEVVFVCSSLPESMAGMLRKYGYRCVEVPMSESGEHFQNRDAAHTIAALCQLYPDGVDWLVVDHYGLDLTWEQQLRAHAVKLMVIDDLADRRHDCDLLLDQNFYLDQDRRYRGLLPARCVPLLGPGYVLLRPEFIEARQNLRDRDGVVRRLLVFFGSTDPGNQTSVMLEALRLWGKKDITVDVVVGGANPWREEIEVACRALSNTVFHCQTPDIAELIAAADVGIGSGGSAMWERCYLGLTTITVVIAENQVRTTEAVAQLGGIIYLGRAETVQASDYLNALERLMANPERVRQVSNTALELVRLCNVPIGRVMHDILATAGHRSRRQL